MQNYYAYNNTRFARIAEYTNATIANYNKRWEHAAVRHGNFKYTKLI